MTARAPLRHLFLLILLFVSGCVYHQTDAREMVKDMNNTRSKGGVYINILWYEGSDDKFDYFSHVYAMLGSKSYKVPTGQLVLNKVQHTNDSQKWVQISQIGEEWSASRLDRVRGIWEADNSGVRIDRRN